MRLPMQSFVAVLFFCLTASAQTVPPHAEGLQEELIEVGIDGGTQRAVLSKRSNASAASKLIVLLPGHPSVVKPEMGNGVMMDSPQLGNFLIRARRHLVTEQTMTLLIDCHTNLGDVCKAEYQASEDRYQHAMAVISAAKVKQPQIKQVYLLSTSMGSISSGFMAKHGQNQFAGVIHTASIDPTAPKSYPQLSKLNYADITIPQAFVHHTEDPCPITQYGYIRSVAEKNKIPLISVSGGGDFKGQPCQAFTQHGFKNKEVQVMRQVLKMVNGQPWISEAI
jgi:hypothetical protein